MGFTYYLKPFTSDDIPRYEELLKNGHFLEYFKIYCSDSDTPVGSVSFCTDGNTWIRIEEFVSLEAMDFIMSEIKLRQISKRKPQYRIPRETFDWQKLFKIGRKYETILD